MSKSTNYTINFEAEEIIITKKFGKAASQIGTPEFKVMQQLRKEFTGFSFVYKTIEKKENKKSYKGLNIDEMKRFVSTISLRLHIFPVCLKLMPKPFQTYLFLHPFW